MPDEMSKARFMLSYLVKNEQNRLRDDRPRRNHTVIANLIQGLVEGSLSPEEFMEGLVRDANLAPKPALVAFFRENIPKLREAMLKGEVTIEGISGPPTHSMETEEISDDKP